MLIKFTLLCLCGAMCYPLSFLYPFLGWHLQNRKEKADELVFIFEKDRIRRVVWVNRGFIFLWKEHPIGPWIRETASSMASATIKAPEILPGMAVIPCSGRALYALISGLKKPASLFSLSYIIFHHTLLCTSVPRHHRGILLLAPECIPQAYAPPLSDISLYTSFYHFLSPLFHIRSHFILQVLSARYKVFPRDWALPFK